MAGSRSGSTSGADAPLEGQAPAADQFRDPTPEGEHPNDSYHPEGKADWKTRPQHYPAASEGIANPDRPRVQKR